MVRSGQSFVSRNSLILKSAVRVIFGFIWLIDAVFKLQPGFADNFSNLIQQSSQGQPLWLSGWFSFWISTTASNPSMWAYLVIFSEFALAISLIFGFMRKIGYSGGILYSLMIWSIPEGFGGPYGPSSTDIGTGIIYAMVFLMLIIINTLGGPSKYSLDYYLEKKFRFWTKVSEFSK